MMLRLALLELRFAGVKLVGAIFILTVGLIGPLLSSALTTSVDTFVNSRSRQILSADLSVSSLRDFKPEEIQTLHQITESRRETRELEFLTMAKGRETSALIEVRGVEASFPIFGEFTFKDGSKTQSAKPLSDHAIAWAFPEALAQLGLQVGDEIEIGKAQFKIEAAITDGPGAVGGGGLAPRIYIGLGFIAQTGLTQFGSQVYHKIYFELPPGVTSDLASARVKATLSDPDIFLKTPADSTSTVERFFSFYRLYLVAISMIVFALSWMSAFYILQVFLQERLKNAGILMTFGAGRWGAEVVAFSQVLLIMMLSLVLAIGVVEIAALLTPLVAGESLPVGFVFSLGLSDVAKILTVTLISSFAFSAPMSIRLRVSSIQDLLSESVSGRAAGSNRFVKLRGLLANVPLVAVFFLLSVWLMKSLLQALEVSGLLLVALLISWVIARFAFRALYTMVKKREGFVRLVALQLARGRFGVNLCFVTLILGSLVLNLVPHLLKSAVSEIQPIRGGDMPALFLFNIPEMAVSEIPEFLKSRDGSLKYLSPMILARLMKVNGEPTTNDQFLRFPVRLSTRAELLPSEKLIAGREFSGNYEAGFGKIPELSVENSFAERNGYKLGDVIEFDVQGVPVQGRIVNYRKVKWTEFSPNFFLIFQPGVLDDAPKTFVASVLAGSQDTLEPDRDRIRTSLQYDLVRRYPDVNVIDIGRALERALELAKSILGPVRVAAWVAVFMSFLVLLGVIVHNLRLRTREIEIDKILGADSVLIRRLISAEYFVLALVASLFGSGFGVLVAVVVSVRILDVPTQLDLLALLLSVVVTVGMTTLIANLSARRVLGLRGTTERF